MTDPEMQVGDDGEIEYTYDSVSDDFKPKRKPRKYRTVQLPLLIILPLALILLGSAGLLLVNTFQPTLCEARALCFNMTAYWQPDVIMASAMPLNQQYDAGGIMYSESGEETPFFHTMVPANYTMPACSAEIPPPDTILFKAGGQDNGEIFAIRGDGSGLCLVVDNLTDENGIDWSHDRTKILFNAWREDTRDDDIFVMDWETRVVINLTNTANRGEHNAKWSPDDRQILFEGSLDRAFPYGAIFTMNADGSGRQRLSEDLTSNFYPDWSPNGNQILFLSDRANMAYDLGLYVQSLTDNRAGLVESWAWEVHSAAWSSDGRQIAVATFNSRSGIWLYDLTSRESRQLTQRGELPKWSPDGQYIAFINENNRLHVVPADGSSSPRPLPVDLQVSSLSWR